LSVIFFIAQWLDRKHSKSIYLGVRWRRGPIPKQNCRNARQYDHPGNSEQPFAGKSSRLRREYERDFVVPIFDLNRNAFHGAFFEDDRLIHRAHGPAYVCGKPITVLRECLDKLLATRAE